MPEGIPPQEQLLRANARLQGFYVDPTAWNDDELREVVSLLMVVQSAREKIQREEL